MPVYNPSVDFWTTKAKIVRFLALTPKETSTPTYTHHTHTRISHTTALVHKSFGTVYINNKCTDTNKLIGFTCTVEYFEKYPFCTLEQVEHL